MRPATFATAFAALLALAACGADGPPTAPGATRATPGLSVAGEVRMGVVVNPAYVER